MRQVLFHIPIFLSDDMPDGIPIYGYGAMLFVAFVVCTVLASFFYPSPNATPFVGPYPYSNPFANPYNNLYPQQVYPGWPAFGPSPALTMYPNYPPGVYPPNLYPQPVNPWLFRPGIGFPGFGGLGANSFGGGASGYGTFGSGLPVGYSPLGPGGF